MRRDLEQLAVPLEVVTAVLATPHRADHAQRLFDLGVRAVRVDAHRRHLLQGRATPCAQLEAPIREDVEHRGTLGDSDGVVVLEGHAHHAVPDADARRLCGDPGEEHLGRAHVRVPPETVVLDRPHLVEAHLLREHRLLDAVADHLALVRRARVGHLGLEDHRELHASPSFTGAVHILD